MTDTANDPTAKLVTPDAEGWSTGASVVDFILGNAVSVSYYLNLIISLTGFDPIETVQNYFGGDWQKLLESAKAIEHLAEYNTAYSDAVEAAMKDLETSWQGNAATSAQDFFATLNEAVDAQVDPLYKIANATAAFAWASFGVAQTVQALIFELGDRAAQWALTQAAAAAAAVTGVGAAAAAALEAVCNAILLVMLSNVAKTIKHLGTLLAASQALLGTITGLLGTAMEFQMPSLGGGSYDHPGVFG